MNRSEIVKSLAPCGLDCTRCAEYAGGEISTTSARLLELLGNYQRIADLKKESRPEFRAYRQFVDLLNIFAQAPCRGCRDDAVYCPINCVAKTCHREQKVDFCFQCPHFPCDRPIPAGERLVERNERMRDIGIEEFFEEQRKKPRY